MSQPEEELSSEDCESYPSSNQTPENKSEEEESGEEFCSAKLQVTPPISGSPVKQSVPSQALGPCQSKVSCASDPMATSQASSCVKGVQFPKALIEVCSEKKIKKLEPGARWSYYDATDTCSINVCDWELYYPVSGLRQSPIDLATKDKDVCEKTDFTPPLKFSYEPDDIDSVVNTGTGVKFNCFGKSKVTGGPLKSEVYQLVQFHFHWGKSEKSGGAEHLLDGHRYPAELHLVHYNTKYSDMSEALKHGDGLCVVGVFIKGQKNNNHAYKNVTDTLPLVVDNGSQVDFDTRNFNVEDLLPHIRNDYTFYEGSLTTPPLNESVMWINMIHAVNIAHTQLHLFRKLKNPIDKPIVDNFRPVQRMYGRKILHQSHKN